jgi:hypothetical protein
MSVQKTGYLVTTPFSSLVKACSMDKLKLTGRNLGRVFHCRLGSTCIGHAIVHISKQPNFKLKTRPKQLLGSLPLAFALPTCSLILFYIFKKSSETSFKLRQIQPSTSNSTCTFLNIKGSEKNL